MLLRGGRRRRGRRARPRGRGHGRGAARRAARAHRGLRRRPGHPVRAARRTGHAAAAPGRWPTWSCGWPTPRGPGRSTAPCWVGGSSPGPSRATGTRSRPDGSSPAPMTGLRGGAAEARAVPMFRVPDVAAGVAAVVAAGGEAGELARRVRRRRRASTTRAPRSTSTPDVSRTIHHGEWGIPTPPRRGGWGPRPVSRAIRHSELGDPTPPGRGGWPPPGESHDSPRRVRHSGTASAKTHARRRGVRRASNDANSSVGRSGRHPARRRIRRTHRGETADSTVAVRRTHRGGLPDSPWRFVRLSAGGGR